MTVISKGWRKYIAKLVDWTINAFLPDSIFYADGLKKKLSKLGDETNDYKHLQSSAIAFVIMSKEYLEKEGKTELTVSCSDVTFRNQPIKDFKITVNIEPDEFG